MDPQHMVNCQRTITLNGTIAPLDYKKVIETCQSTRDYAMVFMILCIAIGTPGSTMAAVTMLSVETTPSSLYILYLSIGDLVTILLRTGMTKTNVKEIEILRKMAGDFSFHVLTLIAFERFMSVKYPWAKRRYLNLHTTRISIVLAALLCVAEFLAVVVISHLTSVAHLADMLIGIFMLGIPGPLFLLFNSLTISGLKAMSNQQMSRRSSAWSAAENSVIYMLASSSIIFILLNGPLIYMRVILYVSPAEWLEDLEFRTETESVRVFAEWCTMLHHSLTFYIYILGTRRFRKQFVALATRTCTSEDEGARTKHTRADVPAGTVTQSRRRSSAGRDRAGTEMLRAQQLFTDQAKQAQLADEAAVGAAARRPSEADDTNLS